MAHEKEQLQDIAAAYLDTNTAAPTLPAGPDKGKAFCQYKAETSYWALHSDQQDIDWYVVECLLNIAPDQKIYPPFGVYEIEYAASVILVPKGEEPVPTTFYPQANLFDHAPPSTESGVSHSDGLSFSLGGDIGWAGDNSKGSAGFGISFNNSVSRSLPGRSIIDLSNSTTAQTVWRFTNGAPVEESTSTWTLRTTYVFQVLNGSASSTGNTYYLSTGYVIRPGVFMGETLLHGIGSLNESNMGGHDFVELPVAPDS